MGEAWNACRFLGSCQSASHTCRPWYWITRGFVITPKSHNRRTVIPNNPSRKLGVMVRGFPQMDTFKKPSQRLRVSPKGTSRASLCVGRLAPMGGAGSSSLPSKRSVPDARPMTAGIMAVSIGRYTFPTLPKGLQCAHRASARPHGHARNPTACGGL